MREGSGLVDYSKQHPQRYIDVGIAEDVAVTVGAGLALRGEKPIVAIYSTFLQRGYDQVIHDVCLENLDVVFAIDRAGLVGGDGATHQGIYDLSYLRAVPNMQIGMPHDANEMRAMLKAAVALGGPKAVRWPRGNVEPGPDVPVDQWPDIEWGSWKVMRQPSPDIPERDVVWLLAIGPTVDYALQAAATRPAVGVVNARFVKPLDAAMLHRLAKSGRALITVEDHTVVGGLGSAVLESLAAAGVKADVTILGVKDRTVPHGDPQLQHEQLGYGPAAIGTAIDAVNARAPGAEPKYERVSGLGGGGSGE